MEEDKKTGRPRVEMPLQVVEMLGSYGATNREIAAHFGVSERTIDSRKAEPEFREAYERGLGKGNMQLRTRQFKAAMTGDRTMLIWLGKQRLGQKDKIANEHTGAGGGPVRHLVDLSALSEEELAILEKLSAKAQLPPE